MQVKPEESQVGGGPAGPHVTVVVVTYQSSGTVERTLAPLRQPCLQGLLRCVVVDNCSTDGTVEILRREASWLELIEGRRNVGYGNGCNRGWVRATTPYALFLNPDAVLEPQALEILVDFMEERPRAGIAAPALLGSTGKPHLAGGLITARRIIREALRLPVEERRRIEPGGAPFGTTWLSGAVQLVRTRLLRELGGFDPRFFMYFEETDLEMRARESGWELWAVGEAVGHHLGAASARASGRKLINYAIADEFFRSRFYYLVKHHGWASAVAAESADVLGSAVRALARWLGGRNPSPPLARLRAPIFRFPDPPVPAPRREPGASEAVHRLTVRTASEGEEPEMLDLLLRAFQRWPAFEVQVPAVEHLRWKMRSDPISCQHQWVGEVEGRIAGIILRVVRRIRVKGRDCLAREGVDAAIDPRFEDQRLYTAIVDHVRESPADSVFDFRMSYSSNPKIRHRSARRGFKALANPIQVLEKPYRARAIVARRRRRHGGRLPALLAVARIELGKAVNRFLHPPYGRRARRGWSITTLERFDDRIGGFFDEAARPFDLIVVRSKDYMNWRYCDPAAGRFRVRVAEQDGRLFGYLVLKIAEGEGSIADLLALPGRSDVVRSLIEDALRTFREAGVELVTCWMISRHPYNGILRRYGFFDSRRDVGFRYRAMHLEESEVEFLDDPRARIHLTQGDSDWV